MKGFASRVDDFEFPCEFRLTEVLARAHLQGSLPSSRNACNVAISRFMYWASCFSNSNRALVSLAAQCVPAIAARFFDARSMFIRVSCLSR